MTQSATGIIERLTDADSFSFTSSGGRYSISAGRDAPSGVDLKLSIYNSSGTLLAVEDGDPRAQPYTMVNDQHLTFDLAAGTYYAIVESHGNYGDQGQYDSPRRSAPRGVELRGYRIARRARLCQLRFRHGHFYGGRLRRRYLEYQRQFPISLSDAFRRRIDYRQGHLDDQHGCQRQSRRDDPRIARWRLALRRPGDDSLRRALCAIPHVHGRECRDQLFPVGHPPPIGCNFRDPAMSITFKRSSRGTTWTTNGHGYDLSLATNVYIGLVSTSHNNVKINPATFTDVSFTGTLNPGPNINAGLPVPGSLSITGKTSTSVSLSWGNVSGETGYAIERSARRHQLYADRHDGRECHDLYRYRTIRRAVLLLSRPVAGER